MSSNKTLAILRAENNMSQRELAKKLNISSGAIGMYESGKRMPSLNRAITIAKLFNVPVETISFSSSNTKIKTTKQEEIS